MNVLRAIFAGFLISLAAIPAGAGDPLLIRVSPTIAFAPANLIVRTTIERHSANRAMEIIADSPRYYRSSEVQLDGDRAPRTTTIEFRSLPSGSYEITAKLFDAQGHPRAEASAQVNVIASGSDRGQ